MHNLIDFFDLSPHRIKAGLLKVVGKVGGGFSPNDRVLSLSVIYQDEAAITEIIAMTRSNSLIEKLGPFF